jgi:hypothetical protein
VEVILQSKPMQGISFQSFEMGKLVVLSGISNSSSTSSRTARMGIWKSMGLNVAIIQALLLMTLCVGNHGSEVSKFIIQASKEIESPSSVASSPSAAALKQNNGDGGGDGGSGPPNGGRIGIESYGNVTVLAGQRGELKCRTFNLANNTVHL